MNETQYDYRIVVQRHDGLSLTTEQPSLEAAQRAVERIRTTSQVAKRVIVEKRAVRPWTVEEVVEFAAPLGEKQSSST